MPVSILAQALKLCTCCLGLMATHLSAVPVPHSSSNRRICRQLAVPSFLAHIGIIGIVAGALSLMPAFQGSG